MTRIAVRSLVSLLAGLLLWQLLIWLFAPPLYVLPPPSQVFTALFDDRAYLAEHARITFVEVILGGLWGIGGGLLVGGALAWSRVARWLGEPYLVALQSFPREALAPLFIVWLGMGLLPRVVMAAMISFFPMAIASLSSLLHTPSTYVKMLESQGATKYQIFRYVRVPSAIPEMISGVKVALPLSVVGAVIGEFMGGSGGLGYVIATSSAAFDTPRTFAALIILAFFGALLLGLIALVERLVFGRYLMHFRETTKSSRKAA
ncbi:MAG: ABC transporter permease subunit [Myxococcota bacterium]